MNLVQKTVLLLAVGLGAWAGWGIGAAGGVMAGYLAGVVGASAGLYVGRLLNRRFLE